MSFNMDDYVDVAERMRKTKEIYPEGVFRPANPNEPFKVVEIGGITYIAYTAAFYRDPFDPCPAIACAWEEVPGRTPYTKGSELMNAETSAWGRCAIAVGLASKKIASADEIKARQEAPKATVTKIKETEQEQHNPWATPPTPAEAYDAWHCKHGDRTVLEGEKNGRAYYGMRCTNYVVKDQCEPIWFTLNAEGKWVPKIAAVK